MPRATLLLFLLGTTLLAEEPRPGPTPSPQPPPTHRPPPWVPKPPDPPRPVPGPKPLHPAAPRASLQKAARDLEQYGSDLAKARQKADALRGAEKLSADDHSGLLKELKQKESEQKSALDKVRAAEGVLKSSAGPSSARGR